MDFSRALLPEMSEMQASVAPGRLVEGAKNLGPLLDRVMGEAAEGGSFQFGQDGLIQALHVGEERVEAGEELTRGAGTREALRGGGTGCGARGRPRECGARFQQ